MLPELTEIKIRRKLLDLTQQQLSDLSDVSQSLIAKIERGRLDPTYSKAKKIFTILEQKEKEETSTNIAKDIHTTKIYNVKTSDTVHDTYTIFRKHDISQLPVYEGDRIVGSISEGTIIKKLDNIRDSKILSQIPIGKIMDDPLPIVKETFPLDTIRQLLQQSEAVLTIRKEKIVGIITKSDFAKLF